MGYREAVTQGVSARDPAIAPREGFPPWTSFAHGATIPGCTLGASG